MNDEAPNFEGIPGGTCEHRTVGPHRAWCHDCREWCYPSDPCVRCKPFVPVDWPARFRAAANAAKGEDGNWAYCALRDLEEAAPSMSPHAVEAIGRALMGGETPDA